MLHRLNDAISAPAAAVFSGFTGIASISVGAFSTDDLAALCGAFAAIVSTAYLIWKWSKDVLRDRSKK